MAQVWWRGITPLVGSCVTCVFAILLGQDGHLGTDCGTRSNNYQCLINALQISHLGCVMSQVHLNHGWQNCFCPAKMSCGRGHLTCLWWLRTGDCNVASSSKTRCPPMTESYRLSDSTGLRHVDVEDASFELEDLLSQPMCLGFQVGTLWGGGSGVFELMSFTNAPPGCFWGVWNRAPIVFAKQIMQCRWGFFILSATMNP